MSSLAEGSDIGEKSSGPCLPLSFGAGGGWFESETLYELDGKAFI